MPWEDEWAASPARTREAELLFLRGTSFHFPPTQQAPTSVAALRCPGGHVAVLRETLGSGSGACGFPPHLRFTRDFQDTKILLTREHSNKIVSTEQQNLLNCPGTSSFTPGVGVGVGKHPSRERVSSSLIRKV